jgi:hypothetical protein
LQVAENRIPDRRFSTPFGDGVIRYAVMRRTLTVTFELTPYQNNQIKLLGRILWPDQSLSRDELCRRLLLDGCDGMIEHSASQHHEHLLEPACLPTVNAEAPARRRTLSQ